MKLAKKTFVASDLRKAFLKKGFFALSLLVLTLFALPAIFLMKGQEQDKQKRQPPIADYAAEVLRNESDFTGCSQRGQGEIKELPLGVEELPVTSHWWTGLPALPVSQSDVVVVGEITNAQAHLSNDKTNVFSEFTLRVEKTLKQKQKNFLANDSIVVVRCGGGVKFSSNKTQYYRTAHQGSPDVGSRYVLFLTYKDKRLSILTGYQLTEAGVMPLDGEDEGQKIRLPFSTYQNVSVDTFLSDLSKAILTTRKREGEQ